jgi:hypothetical protein
MICISMCAAVLAIAGCKTLESETRRISWEQQQAYLAKVRDPRVYGLAIYDTPTGPEIRGGGRLHPGRTEALEMLAVDPARPLVNLAGKSDEQWPVLLDCTAPSSWLEFELAGSLGGRPIGEMKAQLVSRPGDEIPACLSVVSSLRLGQMFIEHPLVYVRMATGSLGGLNRDVSEGPVKGVIGWDLLGKFDQIQFSYSSNQIVLSTNEGYEPNPEWLVASLPLVSPLGVCAVRGEVDGVAQTILIDPAGDFEVAAPGPVSSLKLGSTLTLTEPQTVASPGGIRIGARLLATWRVTICPKAGELYLEQPAALYSAP